MSTFDQSMHLTTTVTYDKALVRRAMHRYLWRRLGTGYFILLAVMVIFTGWINLIHQRSRYAQLSLGLLAMVIALLGIIYYARIRQVYVFLSKMKTPTVKLTFTNTGLQTESDLGSSGLNWEVFDEVMKFSDLWLLVYASSAYLTLPIDRLSEEMKRLIESKISTIK